MDLMCLTSVGMCIDGERKTLRWAVQGEQCFLWEENASLQPLGIVPASDVWGLLPQHLYLSVTLCFFIPLPVSSHYTCASNVIAPFTFFTTEPESSIVFTHCLLICITDISVFKLCLRLVSDLSIWIINCIQ